ncbi:hypothetical protein EAI_15285 [Harpegnathos saltator]|uniref:Uncharacterized protein n=1 Tax=Harpegnathos saltator TaxID=610380 RepID=E2B8B9_HARSA|nr:hypothetical protein EAI_15285 [Harpegnathos saltator]
MGTDVGHAVSTRHVSEEHQYVQRLECGAPENDDDIIALTLAFALALKQFSFSCQNQHQMPKAHGQRTLPQTLWLGYNNILQWLREHCHYNTHKHKPYLRTLY